ncbi:MAG: MerR family transcriptional regulator [Chloroflexota bacterium]
MPDDPYSLADLARLADVTPRTIRYYVAQGLLPSPEAAGSNTRYGEGHLARLRLIRRLQREHLPLAEIRSRLEQLGDEEVIAAVETSAPSMAESSRDREGTLAFIQSLMSGARVSPTVSPPPAEPQVPARVSLSIDAPSPRRALRRMEIAAPDASELILDLQAAPSPRPADSRHPKPSRSQWERLAITPDIEIHVRRPLDRLDNKRVEKLERIARELFAAES